MVERVFQRIAAQIRGLHQAAYLLAALTLASQVLALLRDRLFAHTFGAGHELDLYYAAFRVPDLVFMLVSSLVSAYVLVPRISGMDKEATRKLLSESASFLLIFGGLVCAALAVVMPYILSFLYPGLATPADEAGFVFLARILLIQPILLGVSGVVASVTQVQRRFALFALSPALYNIGIILGTALLYPRYGLSGIGIGVVLGAVAYLAVHIPVVMKAGVLPRPCLPSFSAMLPVMRDSVPRSLALGMNALTALVLTVLASKIATGSIAVFTFASNLQAVPLALFGSSYAIAAFPALSEASAGNRNDEFSSILSAGARHIILWSFISLGLIIVMRAHIVRAVLGTGAFDWGATRLTAALLALLALGLAADGLRLLFSRALYAARQSWRPLLYQIAGGAFTVLLALAFLALPERLLLAPLSAFLKVGDVPANAVLLLALATTLGQIFLVLISLVALRNVAPRLARSIARPLFDGTLAALAGGAAAYATLAVAGGIAPLTTLAAVLAQGLAAAVIGLAAAALALYAVENEEFRAVAGALRRLARVPGERAAALAPSSDGPENL